MKRLLLTAGLAFCVAIVSHAQIILSGISPASVQGNYEFTWADPGGGDWDTPDFHIPNTYVQAEIEFVNDSSAGTNPQGNPVWAEGCNPLVNDLTGKIAVVYRNTCEFGTKALNAQNAGAVGVIIINREDALVNMGGGNDGLSVQIPVVFISSLDGLTITGAMANGPVEMFMGNRAGLYANDLSSNIGECLIPKAYVVPSQLAQNDGEITMEIGTTVRNYGYEDQDSVMVNATVTDPNSNVIYDETVGPFSLTAVDTNSGGVIDSVIILPGQSTEFPMFSLNDPEEGRYTVTYEIMNGSSADDFPDDNTISTEMVISEDFMYCAVDENEEPITGSHYRPSGSYTSYSACISFSDSNASRIGVDGLWFSAAATDSLTNQPFYVKAFAWNDQFDDLDDPNLSFLGLEELESTIYLFTENLEETFVYAEFDNDIPLTDNQRYLFCVQTFDPTLFIGFDTRTQYTTNQAVYRQPISVVEVSAEYDAIGFGPDVVPAIRLGILDSSEVVIPVDTTPEPGGVNELAAFEMKAYPNPTKDQLIVETDVDGSTSLTIVDMAGNLVYQDNINFRGNTAPVDVRNLDVGIYFLQLRAEDGRLSQMRIVKQ